MAQLYEACLNELFGVLNAVNPIKQLSIYSSRILREQNVPHHK